MAVRNKILAVAGLALVVELALWQETIAAPAVQDFDTAGTPYTLTNFFGAPAAVLPGGPTGNFLRLVPQTPDNLNTIAFDQSALGLYSQIIAEFDFRMTPADFTRADGFGFALLHTSLFGACGAGPGFAERPTLPNSIGVGFDIYQNTEVGELSNNFIRINFNGAELAIIDIPLATFDLGDGIFHHARITVDFSENGASLSVLLDGSFAPVTGFLIPGALAYESRVAFGARTGSGGWANHDLDNINVQFNDPFPVPPSPTPNFFGINPNGWIQTKGWNMLLPLLNPSGCSGGGEESMRGNWTAPHLISAEDPKAGEAWANIDFGNTALSTGWGGAALFEQPTWISNHFLESMGFFIPNGDVVDFERLVNPLPGGISEGMSRLAEIVPGTEHVTLVPNGDFEDQGPECPQGVHANPTGWTRPGYSAGAIFANSSVVPAPASTGSSVAQAFVGDFTNCSLFVQNVALDPDTEYVLSAYLWSFGNVAVVDLDDRPGERELALLGFITDAASGYFQFGNFNTRDTGTEFTLRVFGGCSDQPHPFSVAAQLDNIAITPAAEFRPPDLAPRPPAQVSDDVLGLATTYVDNRTGAPLAVEICSSSDDSSQIWVNNQLITNISACRGTSSGCSERRHAILPPGISKIAVLVWEGGGEWSFRLGIIRASDGHQYTDADSSELAFLGTGEGDPDIVGQTQYLIARTIETPCSVIDFNVLLTGVGPGSPGDPLTVTERLFAEVASELAIENVSNGGQVGDIPAPPAPPTLPIGQFQSHGVVGMPADCSTVNDTLFDGAGTYTSISTTGGDIWADGDTFEFAYKRLEGDFDMSIRITSRSHSTNLGIWGKFGLMARQTLENDAKFGFLQDHLPLVQSDDTGRYERRFVHGSAGAVDEPAGTESFSDPNLISGYVSFGSSANLKVESAPFSLELWMRPSGDLNNRAILSSSLENSGYFLIMNRFGLHNIDLAAAGVNDQMVDYEFIADTWYHIAAVQHFEGSSPSYVEFFVNGASIGSFFDSRNYLSSEGKDQRLGWAFAEMRRFNGAIDEVAVYARALESSEILQHYQDGLAGEGNCPQSACPPGLISYWKFDEGSGTVVSDSADGNTGTIITALTPPVWTTGMVNGALLFEDSGAASLKHPDCMRLTRRGNLIEAWASNTAGNPGFDSADDANWALIFTDDWGPAAQRRLYAGFANSENGTEGCAEQTIEFQLLRCEGALAPELYDSVLGKTITWNVSREQVNGGLGYSVNYPVPGKVDFSGDGGESVIQGQDKIFPSGVNLPEGSHDEVERTQSSCLVAGWAVDPDCRNIYLTVRILSDGIEVAQIIASSFRQDLEDAGVCPGGTCGFEIPLWGLITNNVDHSITVQAQDPQTGEWVNLGATPKTLNCVNAPPDCSNAFASPSACWPPNHTFSLVQVLGIIDPDGDPVRIAVTGITQDEPVLEAGSGSGHTCPDGVLVDVDGDGSAEAAGLRCERSGKGNGRVYAVSFTADDGKGGLCQGSASFCVPHDQSPAAACVDDGQNFDSTGCSNSGGGAAERGDHRPILTLDEFDSLTPQPLFLRGDVQFDDERDLSDAIAILHILYISNEKFICEDSADVNDDGKLDISDPISLLLYLYLGSAAIQEPAKEIGHDPTPDELSCD